jgi:hypothetical protein
VKRVTGVTELRRDRELFGALIALITGGLVSSLTPTDKRDPLFGSWIDGVGIVQRLGHCLIIP